MKKIKSAVMAQQDLTAKKFLEALTDLKSTATIDNSRFFSGDDKDNKFLFVRMAYIFALAKEFTQMEDKEIEKLLGSHYYEARMGAVSIMDFKARNKKITEEEKKALFDLYIKHHDRINNWDMVDRSAVYVIGGYLSDKPRAILYKLAKSKKPMERRTAIVSTYYFIRQNDVDDTFKIAEILVNDKHDLINKAVGSWVREAGKKDQQQLLNFLDRHAATIPRTALRYAIEKLDKKTKDHYMGLTKK